MPHKEFPDGWVRVVVGGLEVEVSDFGFGFSSALLIRWSCGFLIV